MRYKRNVGKCLDTDRGIRCVYTVTVTTSGKAVLICLDALRNSESNEMRSFPFCCWAGACLFLPNEERVDLKQPVSTRSSILLGELIAIKIAFESIKLEMEKLLVRKVMLFSDSQSAVGILTLGWENKSHTSVVFEIKQIMDILNRQNVEIDILDTRSCRNYREWNSGQAD